MPRTKKSQTSAGNQKNISLVGDAYRSSIDPPRLDLIPDPMYRGTKRSNSSFFLIYRYTNRLNLFLMCVGYLMAVVTGVCSPVQMIVFGQLAEDVVNYGVKVDLKNYTSETRKYIDDQFITDVDKFQKHYLIIGLITFVGTYISIIALNYTSLRQMYNVRCLYFKKLLSQDVAWFDLNASKDFGSVMIEDLIKVEEGLGEKASIFIHHTTAFFSCFFLALGTGWRFALICLTSFPLTLVVMLITGRITDRYTSREAVEYNKAGQIAEEIFSSIQAVIAFEGQKKESVLYDQNLIYAKQNNMKRIFFNALSHGILWFLIYSMYSLSFWYATKIVTTRSEGYIEANYTPGTIITIFYSIMIGCANFGIATSYIETFVVAYGASVRIFSVIDSKPKINTSGNIGHAPEKIYGTIKFRNVFFKYPSRPKISVLRGINISILAGQRVAFSGPTGAGKSTCVHLLQRMYNPDVGIITIDEIDNRDFKVSSLRKHVSIVDDEPVLFNTTISQNILLGDPYATEFDVKEAAKISCAHDFIMKLPKGYETIVGTHGGIQLSNGQKQRIALARALIRQPSILVLDEATSALDSMVEIQVLRALDKVLKGTTIIYVGNRLATVRSAHKIFFIANGDVVEEGTHSELMKRRGAYYHLMVSQIQNYATDDDDPILPTDSMASMKLTTSYDSSLYVFHHSTPIKTITMFGLLKYNSNEWPQLAIGCIGSLLVGSSQPIFSMIFASIIGILRFKIDDYVVAKINFFCLLFVVMGIIVGVATFTQIFMFGLAGENLTMRLRNLLFQCFLNQEMAWFEDPDNDSGILCTRLATETTYVQGATGRRLGTILQSFSTCVIAFSMAMFYHWKFGLAVSLFAPIIFIAAFLDFRANILRMTKKNNALEKANNLAIAILRNIRTVISLNQEAVFVEEYEMALLPSVEQSNWSNHLRAFLYSATRSILFFCYAFSIYFGASYVTHGDLEVHILLKLTLIVIMSSSSIVQAFTFSQSYQQGMNAARNIISTLNRKQTVKNCANLRHGKDWKCMGDIDFNDVIFSYPLRPQYRTLKNFKLDISQNQTVAIVGPSGSGKSTLFKLLLRFYDPNSGTIKIDNKLIKNEISLSTLRNQMGIATREPLLFNRTIRENIAYGDNSRDIPVIEVAAAAQIANIHDFIVSLPRGYETVIGKKGSLLSSGQKQLIGIARAIIRKPRILLMDEATVALPEAVAIAVQDSLYETHGDRTSIIIAHRLATIKNVDYICVMNQGKVVEIGSHVQLMKLKGLYYTLYNLQMADIE